MSVKYKVIERGEPGVVGGGTKKFYASLISSGSLGIEALTDRIQQMSTVTGADIRAVLYAIADIVPQLLSEGQIVTIGDLGNFRLSVSSEGSDTEEEVTKANIRKSRILFRPGSKFANMLSNLEYEKS
ncbi:MAG: DNA-binding protein [Bacteroidetes bacterium]|jgi:predicted histone-like DNA-binding protein|nr:DNA-binding protein [Bacteroidota bacterium]|tara:strand:+ start:33692 stop:34075 length:384 start_codon:yes stop_codon:yes gene_type:complete